MRMNTITELIKGQKSALLSKFGIILTIFLGVLGYICLSDNYVHQNICTKSNSFGWVRFVYIILVFFYIRIKRGKSILRIEKLSIRLIYFLLMPAVALLIEELVWNEILWDISFKCIVANYILITLFTYLHCRCFCL